jgi:hypothetical protein
MSSNGNSNNSPPAGIGFTGLLTILFIALKLLHKVAWSWWWVLSPLWIATAFVVFILIIVAIVAAVKR